MGSSRSRSENSRPVSPKINLERLQNLSANVELRSSSEDSSEDSSKALSQSPPTVVPKTAVIFKYFS